MNQEQLAKARKDFELGLVFHVGKMFPEKETGGCLLRDEHGIYVMEHIEAAWRGYVMAAKHTQGMLERFNKDRYIAPWMIGKYQEMLNSQANDKGSIPEIFRIVLTIVGDAPK